MKIFLYLGCLICCCGVMADAAAKTKKSGKENPSQGEMTGADGLITSVSEDGNTFRLMHKGKVEREFKINDKTQIIYVGIPEADREIRRGYFAKTRPGADNFVKSIFVSPELAKHIGMGFNPGLMTVEQVFRKVDENNDEKIDFQEQVKYLVGKKKYVGAYFLFGDQDKSGYIELDELEHFLSSRIIWWKMSRKTPEQWMKAKDKDGDQQLSYKEYFGSKGGHGPDIFKRIDKDGSGNWDLEELRTYWMQLTKAKPVKE